MIIDSDLVAHIAHLSRIELSDEKRKLFSNQLSRIVEYVDKLKELDTTGVAPITNGLDLSNVHRKDELAECLRRQDVLGNAAGSDGQFFKVPKVIE